MMAQHLPVIRADYNCVDYYVHQGAPPVDAPILAIAGTQDDQYNPRVGAGWASYTTKAFTLRILNHVSHGKNSSVKNKAKRLRQYMDVKLLSVDYWVWKSHITAWSIVSPQAHFFPKERREDTLAIIQDVVLNGNTDSHPVPEAATNVV